LAQKTSNEKDASHFTNEKHTSKKRKELKRPPVKKEASHFMNEKCTPKMQGAQKHLIKREASCFMNKKCTPKKCKGHKRPLMKKEPSC
jgi:hypothetical protein